MPVSQPSDFSKETNDGPTGWADVSSKDWFFVTSKDYLVFCWTIRGSHPVSHGPREIVQELERELSFGPWILCGAEC